MDDAVARMLRLPLGEPSVLDEDAAEKLARYVLALLERARELNLTAATDFESAVEVLVRPSLSVRRAWNRPEPPRLALDVGSGNGFPGVAVAVLWPETPAFLVERRRKKAHAIADCLTRAGIRNAEALAFDVRDLPRTQPDLPGLVDLVTVRAVGALAPTTRITAGLLAPGGRLVHWKSVDLDDAERQEGARAARALDLVCLDEIERGSGSGRLVVYERPGDAP
jgi:16S rRNA (guanine527-N7)-methyltransferase